MEVLDDDDFSDLYADVEVQASSAIRALHGLREMPPGDSIIFENATRGEKGKGDGFSGADIAGGNGGIYEQAADGDEDGGLTELPLDNGDTCDDGSESEADDGNKQRFDDRDDNDKYDSHKGIIGLGVTDMRRNEGGLDIEADEKKYVVIDGNEKSVNGGNCSRRKVLKYDSFICKKRKVDEGAQQVHKQGKNADAGLGNGRDLCFSRVSEDNQPNCGKNDGGGKVASARVFRDPVTLELDKYGSVQISDSVEDDRHEVPDCNSDGMLEVMETSDDTNRRNASSRSHKVASVSEPGSSQSGWSQHCPCSSSPSVIAALSNDDIEKGHKHAKNPSLISFGELEKVVTREYHPSKYSKSHTTKPSIRDGNYYQRQRGLMNKELNQHKKSNDMPDLKTHLINEDASYAIDVKHPYSRHITHGKRMAVLNFNSNEKDMPYCNQSESFFTDFSGLLPGYHLGPAYSKSRNWNIHPSYGYKAGGRGGHNMSARQDFIEKRNSKIDYEAMEDNWYSKQRRHVVQNQGNTEESRKLIPKYYSSAVNTRGTQFSNKGDALHFRRTKRDYLPPNRDYDNYIKGKSRRFMPSSDRHRDYLVHKYDQNIAHERREMESSRRGNRKSYSPHNNSDNLWYEEAEDNGRRGIKHRPLPFCSYEEPCAPGRGRFQGAASPIPERDGRHSWKERNVECGQYGTRTATFDTREGLMYHLSENHDVRRRHYQRPKNTYIANESIKDHRDLDHFVRRRHHQQPDVLHSREEVYKSRQQDDTIFHSEGPSYHFRRTRRNNRPDDRHAFGRVAELTDEREVDRHRFKVIREEDRRNQFDGCLKYIQADNFVQMSPTYQYSVDSRLVVGKKCTPQSSRRTSEGGDDFNCGKHDLTEWNDNQKPRNFEDLGDFNPEKAASTNEGKVGTDLNDKKMQDKFSKNQQDEFLDIEEGQIISEEINHRPMKCVIASEDMTQINDMELPETASNGIGVVEKLGDQKIQEIMAKMERRRERFKEPITSGRDMVKNSNQSLDLAVETDKSKLERPARKRRWLGT